jgi:hypothetical protein
VKYKSIVFVLAVCVMISLSGCGGGGGSSTSSSTKSVTVVDNLITGLSVKVGDKTLTTDSNGQFSYTENETASFYIGGIKLGEISEIPSDNRIFIQDLVGVDRTNINDPLVVKIARFLQSLDSDENTDEIEILSADNAKFNDITTDIDNTNLSVLTSKGFSIVSEDDAKRHLENALKQFGIIHDDVAPDFTSNVADGDTNVEVNKTITLTFTEDIPKKYILSGDYITLQDSSNADVAFYVTLDKNVSTIKPKADLANLEQYTLTLKSSIADYAGNELAGGANIDKVINFTTTANQAPTWTQASYNTGLTIDDSSNAEQTIQDLTAISSDTEGDTITYSVVSVDSPHPLDDSVFENSLFIDSGILKIQNLQTNNPATSGTTTIVVRATATGGYNDTNVSFEFNDVQ